MRAVHEEAVCAAVGDQVRSLVFQFQADHEAGAADGFYSGDAADEAAEARVQPGAERLHVFHHVFFFHRLDAGYARRAADGVAAERRRVRARF